LLENALSMLRKLGYKAGDTLYLVLDDTQKQKRGKKMDVVSKIFLHAEKTYVHGHTILGLAFVYRGVVIPCAVRLWASKEYCDKSKKSNNKHETVEFKKLTELAADTITSVKLPPSGKAIVLFDRFYLCDTVVKACENKGYTYIGAVKNNRNFFSRWPTERQEESGSVQQKCSGPKWPHGVHIGQPKGALRGGAGRRNEKTGTNQIGI
jgi:hypothetical protein